MRLVSFCPRYVPMLSGGETAAHALNAALAARGHDVSVVTSTQSEDRRVRKDVDGVEVYYGRVRPAHARYVAEREPDALFAQFEMAVPTVRFAIEAGLPVVVFCHGPYGYSELAEHGLAHAVDLFIFNSVFLLNLANRNVHHVVVNPPLDRDRVRAPDGLVRRFVTLVNLHDNKGPHIFHTLAHVFIDKPFLAVKGAYGQQLVQDLPNVEVRETTPDIGRIYGESRIVLIPSAEESFGLVGVEAQSNGVPVVASDIPSLRESLGKGALFVAREDIAGWVTALRRLDDPDVYAEMSHRARANADSFDTARDVDVLVTMLEAIVRRYRWRRRPTLARLHEEREERSRRIREIFRRGLQREPTFTELLTFLDGTQSLAQLEHVIPTLRGQA